MEKRVLINRWLESCGDILPIYDEASVSLARQRVREAGATFNASETLVESAALIASELTHNHLAHARQGYFCVKAIERHGVKGLEVVAADMGPGVQKSILSGAPGAGKTLGAGLEGVVRIADEVDVETREEEGVRIAARKFEAKTTPAWEVAIAGKPFPGEVISGDDAACLQTDSGFLAAVCDGLGHGPEARESSNRAIDVVSKNSHLDLDDLTRSVNSGLAEKRGCAMGVLRYRREKRALQCVLAGDVRAQLYHLRDTHFFTSTPFILGEPQAARRKVRIEEITVKPGSVFVMFTDGFETKTSLKEQLDVLRQPAIVIAQYLLHTHSRGNDDALAFVARVRA
jgi:anti-sigma regulatory factor (Ser/Thr protein kinase)/serine/threonine protein phosphatase PrpC